MPDKYETKLIKILEDYKNGTVDLEVSVRLIFGVMTELMGGPC